MRKRILTKAVITALLGTVPVYLVRETHPWAIAIPILAGSTWVVISELRRTTKELKT